MTKRFRGKPRVSSGFLCSLFGIGMTVFSWYAPWAFPAWPALSALSVLDRWGDWTELAFEKRAAVLVVLIALNVGTWAVALRVLLKLASPLRAKTLSPPAAAFRAQEEVREEGGARTGRG